jgi:hypothetical protein
MNRETKPLQFHERKTPRSNCLLPEMERQQRNFHSTLETTDRTTEGAIHFERTYLAVQKLLPNACEIVSVQGLLIFEILVCCSFLFSDHRA